jgi:hypothetical protein
MHNRSAAHLEFKTKVAPVKIGANGTIQKQLKNTRTTCPEITTSRN